MTQNVILSTVEKQNTENSIEENAVETSVYNAETSTCEAVEAVAQNDDGGASGSIVDDVGTDGENEIQRAARRYRQAELYILPANDKRASVQNSNGKLTYLEWKDPKYKTIPVNKRNRQLALVCGAASGNVEVIDFDFEGEDYENWRQEVVRLGGDIYADVLKTLVIERTQSAGYHVGYRVKGLEEGKKLETLKLTKRVKTFDSSDVRTNENGGRFVEYKGKNVNVDEQGRGVYCTIETKAEDGYVIIAPSLGNSNNPSTKYESIQNDWAEIPTIPKEIREKLIQAARNLSTVKPDQKPTKNPRDFSSVPNVKKTPSTVSNFPSIVYQFKEPTNGDDSASSILRANPEYIVERLEAHGNKLIERRDNKIQFNRATSKKFPKVDFTLFVDAQTGEAGALHSFDFKATPFEDTNKYYTPLEVIALLDFYGDESAASSAVCEAYNAQIGKSSEYKNLDLSYLFGCKPDAAQGTAQGATNDATENKGKVETTDEDDALEEEENELLNFPTECLPAYLRDFVKYEAERKSISEGTGALCSLPPLSAIIGDLAAIDRLPTLGWGKTNCSFKTALVASSGVGKSGILEDSIFPFKEINDALKEQRERQEADIWARGYDKKKRQIELDKLGRKAAYMPTNATIEGLTEQIKVNQDLKHSGTLLYADEGARLFDLGAYKNGKGVNTELSDYIQLFDGRGVESVRKGKDAVTLSHSFLSVLCGFQTKRLAEQINDALIDSGFLSRFLITFERDRSVDELEREIPYNEQIEKNYRKIFQSIYAINKQVNSKSGDIYPFKLDVPFYQFTDEAIELLKAYKHEVNVKSDEFKSNELARQFIKKSCYSVTRAALVFHFIKWTQRDDETLPENEKVQSDLVDFPKELYVNFGTLLNQKANVETNSGETTDEVKPTAEDGAKNTDVDDVNADKTENTEDGADVKTTEDVKTENGQGVLKVEVPTQKIDADTTRRAIELTRYTVDAALYAYNEILIASKAPSGLQLTDDKIKEKVLNAIRTEQQGDVEKFIPLSGIVNHINKWKHLTKKDKWTRERQACYLKALVDSGVLESDSKGRYRIAL